MNLGLLRFDVLSNHMSSGTSIPRFVRTALTTGVALLSAQLAHPAPATPAAVAQAAAAPITAGAEGPVSDTAASFSGTKRALLVGINNYKAVPHLMGSLNDVAAIKQILITRWGFDAANIRILTEQAATRAAIMAALRELVRESGPNDTLVFHYSGHGSQVQDLNGDEDDGLDETLVPYDGRTPGIPDIVDDELDSIFARLRSNAALIILDSCHSGTATRGVDFRPRGIPQDMRIDEYQDPAVRPSAGVATRAIVPRMQSRQIVMSAVEARQEALDGPIDGEYHGIFTYALSRSLASSPPGASPREVFTRVGQEMKRLQAEFGGTSMPEPQLEGSPAAIDRPLLGTPGLGVGGAVGLAAGGAVAGSAVGSVPGPGGGSVARLAWIDVQVGVAGQAILTQGVLLGAARGSTWAIYPPGETAFAPGRALAVAIVTGNVGTDARVTLQPAGAHLEAGSRAVALMPAAAALRVPVRILDAPEAQRLQIESILARTIKDVEIVGPERPARFLIDSRDNVLRLLSADGLQVVGTFDARTDGWADCVARVISRSSSASELLALDNPLSRITLQAQIVGADTGSTRDIVVVADTQPAQLHIRHPNEARTAHNSLQISVTVSDDTYLTIVDVDSQGNANLLFPNGYQRADFWPDGRVTRQQPLLIPDSLAPGGHAGFFWDYGPPAGQDTIRVFASTDAATAHLIRDRVRSLQAGSTRGFASSTRVAEGFDGLRQQLSGVATRGVVVQQDSIPAAATGQQSGVPDWAATSLTVSIQE